MTAVRRKNRKHRRGLTLIEILVVVTILGIIASIIGVNVLDEHRGAQVQATAIQMKNIGDALELYRLKTYGYPTTEQGLDALASLPSGGQPILSEIPNDAWDNHFVYTSPGSNGKLYEIASKGPDGALGTEDDIAGGRSKYAAR